MMKKILTLVIIICVSIGYASAYSFYINGSITDDSGNPVIGQEVIVYTLSLNNSAVVTTDAAGHYSIQYWVQNGYFPIFYVQTWEWCHGEFSNNIQTATSFNGVTYLDFQMCQQVNVPNDCIADFQVQKISNHIWGFINTSRGNVDSLKWNFGNGLTSTDNTIVYEYPDHGLYSACLNIFANSNCSDQTCDLVPVGPWEFADGHVEMNNLDLPDGQLYVYQLTGNNKENVWTYKVDIEDGNFNIPYLLFEDYFIQAIPTFNISGPYFPKYLPTYYGQSLLWQDADSIDFLSSVSFFEIDLLSHNEIFFGHGSISGNVVRNDSVPAGTDPIWIENNIIPPITVFLLDESETTLDFRFFEEGGSYSFDDIPYGNYILRTEKFRSLPFDVYVSISEEFPTEDGIEIQVYETSILLNLDELLYTNSDIQIFPNPVSDYLNIKYENNLSGQITIYDITGRTMYHNINYHSKSLIINIQDYTPGVYIIQINLDDGKKFNKKFNKMN